MANSILDIKGIHVCVGCFSDGADVDLFSTAKKRHRASVVFGRNGSGKSTIASCIAKAASAGNGAGCFYDEVGSSIMGRRVGASCL